MGYALVFGGSSYEHEISIVSAIVLKKLLKGEIEFLFLDSDRDFYHIDKNDMKSTYFSTKAYKKAPKLVLKKGGFYESKMFGEKRLAIDTVINLIHGRDGEDGKIAALMEFFGIPCIGPHIEASVVSYNKLFTKMYAREIGIDVIDYRVLTRDSDKNSVAFPSIIKPLRLGSSIGVSIVREKETLEYALDVAFEFDKEVIAEPFLEGIKEYNLAGSKVNGEFVFSKIEEVQKEEFLDFEKKYYDFSRSGEIADSGLDEGLKERLKEAFIKVYGDVFTGAIIRCDFFYKDGTIYLNEINPIPGSLANYLFEDINVMVDSVSAALKSEKEIAIDYAYINRIKAVKGK